MKQKNEYLLEGISGGILITALVIMLSLIFCWPMANAQFFPLTDSAMIRDMWNFMHYTGDTMSGPLGMDSNVISDIYYTDYKILDDAGLPSYKEGIIFYDSTLHAFCYYDDISGIKHIIGHQVEKRIRNTSGGTITAGKVVYQTGVTGQTPNVALAKADGLISSKVMEMTSHSIADNAYGNIVTFGPVSNIDMSAFTAGWGLFLSGTTAGDLVHIPPDADTFYIVAVGVVGYSHATQGVFGVNIAFVDRAEDIHQLDSAMTVYFDSSMVHLDGMAYDKPSFTLVQVNGVAGIQMDIEKVGTGDMVFRLDGVNSTLDCTTGGGAGGKARVALTAGSDVNTPTTNYVYVTNSGGTATLNSATSLPTSSFGWIGKVIIPDTVTFNSVGVYGYQRYTESFLNDSRGTESHAREKLRALGAVYISGAVPTCVIDSQAAALDSVDVTTTAGSIYQLHRQSWPSTDAADVYYYGNGQNQYEQLIDLNAALATQDGSSMSGKYFNLIIWGAINYSTGDCKTYVNLPDDFYISSSGAIGDGNQTADYSVPDDMRSVAFLIARVVLGHKTTASGRWTSYGCYSLLGQPVGVRSAGATAGDLSNEFSDSEFRIFDNGDATKLIAFEASNITTGNTRIFTMPDENGVIVTTNGFTMGGNIDMSTNDLTNGGDIIGSNFQATSSILLNAIQWNFGNYITPGAFNSSSDYVFKHAFKSDSTDSDSEFVTIETIEDSLALRLLITAQAADVDSTGTQIAAALADRANIHDTLTMSFSISDIDDTWDWGFQMRRKAITVVSVSGICYGGTNVIGVLMEYDNNGATPVVMNSSDWTFTTGEEETTSLSNPSIDDGDYLGWKTTSVSGTVDFFTLTINYTVD